MVGQIRTRERGALGDAGKPALVARMRAHAKFGEYVPLPVTLIGLIEMAGAARTPLIVAGAALLVARLPHASGLDRPAPTPLHLAGIVVTLVLTARRAGGGLFLPYPCAPGPCSATTRLCFPSCAPPGHRPG